MAFLLAFPFAPLLLNGILGMALPRQHEHVCYLKNQRDRGSRRIKGDPVLSRVFVGYPGNDVPTYLLNLIYLAYRLLG